MAKAVCGQSVQRRQGKDHQIWRRFHADQEVQPRMPQKCRYYLKSKTKVINPSYRPPNNPLKLFYTNITINQLVVGSISTAGTKFNNKVNILHDLCGHLGV